MSVIELQAVVAPRLNQVVDGDSNAALAVLAALGAGDLPPAPHRQGPVRADVDDQRQRVVLLRRLLHVRRQAADRRCATASTTAPVPSIASTRRPTDWVCLAVRTQHEFDALLGALDLPELATDVRFAGADARAANDDALAVALGSRFAEKPAAEWESILRVVDVGCVEAFMKGMPAFTSFDPVLRETGLTVEIDHPMFGSIVRAAPPVSFSETPGRIAPPCVRGEHNHAILAEIGYSERRDRRPRGRRRGDRAGLTHRNACRMGQPPPRIRQRGHGPACRAAD